MNVKRAFLISITIVLIFIAILHLAVFPHYENDSKNMKKQNHQKNENYKDIPEIDRNLVFANDTTIKYGNADTSTAWNLDKMDSKIVDEMIPVLSCVNRNITDFIGITYLPIPSIPQRYICIFGNVQGNIRTEFVIKMKIDEGEYRTFLPFSSTGSNSAVFVISTSLIHDMLEGKTLTVKYFANFPDVGKVKTTFTLNSFKQKYYEMISKY